MFIKIALIIILAANGPTPNEERVELLENFSWTEIAVDGALLSYSLLEQATQWETKIFDKSLMPMVGGSSIDRWFSDLAYDRSGGFLHYRIPEIYPYVLIGTAATYFSIEAIGTWIDSRSWIENDLNGDHKIFALMESYIWMLSIYTTCAHIVGRKRPYVDRGWTETHSQGHGDEFSFFSGHTSTAFLAAAFVARHIGDVMEYRVLKDSSPAKKFWLGRFLPSLTLYGMAAYTGYSRIYEQQHYFSDVLIGALLGTVVANVVYSFHFEAGHPRQRSNKVSAAPLGPGGSLGMVLRYDFD
jgi:membrane-associated phospholipid phosphatase